MTTKRIYVPTAVAAILLVEVPACVTRQTGWIDCTFDRGGMIAQLSKVDLQDQVVGPVDGSPEDAANMGAHVDAGGHAFAAEPRVAADGAAPRR